MPSPTESEPAESLEHDEQLAALLNELAEAQRAGHDPPIDRLTKQHPHLADELRYPVGRDGLGRLPGHSRRRGRW